MNIKWFLTSAVPSKDSTTDNVQQAENEPYYESDNGAGDSVALPPRSSRKVSKDANKDNNDSSTPAEVRPENGETNLEFYESDNGSDDFVDLSKYRIRIRKEKEKIPAEVIENVEAADVDYESDNGSGDEVELPPIRKDPKKKVSAWDFFWRFRNFLASSSVDINGRLSVTWFSIGITHRAKYVGKGLQ